MNDVDIGKRIKQYRKGKMTQKELASKIQENIKNNLSSMVEIKASNINVHIMEVICDRIDAGV